MPPPKTYNPPPQLPILDCDRVEDGSADSTERIHDSSSGFDGVEKVEKLEKSSQDSPRKEKPVQGREELECSRQSSHHDHPQLPSCSHRCSATTPLPPVAASPNSTPTCTTSASPPAVITQSRSCPEHSVVDAVSPPPQAAITSTCSPDTITGAAAYWPASTGCTLSTMQPRHD